jgi:trehalose/maltose hydrolase-like predicted phosphorylase
VQTGNANAVSGKYGGWLKMATQPKQTLFNIAEEVMLILEDIEDAEGEITDEQVQQLIDLDAALDHKVDNILLYCEELDVRSNMLKTEAKALTSRANMFENEKNRLREYLQKALVAMDKRKVKTDKFTVSIGKKTTIKYDEKNIPLAWKLAEMKVPLDELPIDSPLQKYVKNVVLNKSGIAAAVKSQDIEGVTVDDSDTTMTVRR